jgi:hypothetical protein
MSQESHHRLDGWGKAFLVIGIGSVLNAFWMLAAPEAWYEHLPAAVPDFGPFNIHFVRDIGCAYLTVGLALIWAARSHPLRFGLISVVAIFFVAHSLLHVYDTARGHVDAAHWLLDFPAVHLPAIFFIFAARRFAPDHNTSS